jgi:glycosyltransferase involved in cell wall biosynthesis
MRLSGPAGLSLSVIIPFFNPGEALRPTVLAVVECLTDAGISFEIIAVCDGSTDGSADTIADVSYTRVISNPSNQGKGAVLRQGFAAAAGAWIGFIDADGDINPRHLVDYLNRARDKGCAGVYADKRHSHSASAATGERKVMSLTYSTLVSSLFRIGIRDTQTGCKIFRRDVVAQVLPRLFVHRFAFDLELFVAAKMAGITDFVGAPVALERRSLGSTINSRAILRTVIDTFVVYRRHCLRARNRREAAGGTARIVIQETATVQIG